MAEETITGIESESDRGFNRGAALVIGRNALSLNHRFEKLIRWRDENSEKYQYGQLLSNRA